jgi:hypothetical protein
VATARDDGVPLSEGDAAPFDRGIDDETDGDGATFAGGGVARFDGDDDAIVVGVDGGTARFDAAMAFDGGAGARDAVASSGKGGTRDDARMVIGGGARFDADAVVGGVNPVVRPDGGGFAGVVAWFDAAAAFGVGPDGSDVALFGEGGATDTVPFVDGAVDAVALVDDEAAAITASCRASASFTRGSIGETAASRLQRCSPVATNHAPRREVARMRPCATEMHVSSSRISTANTVPTTSITAAVVTIVSDRPGPPSNCA